MTKISEKNSETVFVSQGFHEQRTTNLVAEGNRNSFSHSSGGWKSEIKVLVLLLFDLQWRLLPCFFPALMVALQPQHPLACSSITPTSTSVQSSVFKNVFVSQCSRQIIHFVDSVKQMLQPWLSSSLKQDFYPHLLSLMKCVYAQGMHTHSNIGC